MRLKADFIGTGRYLPTPNAVPPLTLRPTYLPPVLSGEVDLPIMKKNKTLRSDVLYRSELR